MSIKALPTLPTPPDPASDSKAEFLAKAQAFTAAQKKLGDALNNTFIPEVNAFGVNLDAVLAQSAAIETVAENVSHIAVVANSLPGILAAPTRAEAAAAESAASAVKADLSVKAAAENVDVAEDAAQLAKDAAQSAENAKRAAKTSADAAAASVNEGAAAVAAVQAAASAAASKADLASNAADAAASSALDAAASAKSAAAISGLPVIGPDNVGQILCVGANGFVLSAIQSGDVQFGLCALAGGGFAISWSNFNTGVASFRVFNNAGAPTISDTQWSSIAASSAQVSSAVCQLSNGNLVLLRSAANANTKYAIYTPSGVPVKAETLLTTDSFAAQPYIIQPGTGYFCLRVGAQSTNKFYVFNDAGDMQGAPYEPVVNNNTVNPATVLWDGADFFAVFATTAENQMFPIRLVKIPTSGGDGATVFSPYKIATGAQAMGIDAYWDGNNIAIITSPY